MKHLTLIIFAFFLSACAPPPSLGDSTADNTIYDPVVVVQHDDQRSVTCWVYMGDRAGGIFCMTDREINGQ